MAPPIPQELRLPPPSALIEPIADPGVELLGEVAYDLPVEANDHVTAELEFLVEERHDVITRWLERADRYEEFVKRTLAEYELPSDLHHLAIIESGYHPTARSRAGAVGIWQLMPPTARQLGLRVDREVDERMDPVRSTHAAARHLRWLRRTIGDWALVAAAYNAGSGRVSRGLDAIGAESFWDLASRGDLSAETKQYVPRLYAVTTIGRNRERFGFPPSASLTNGLDWDAVRVEYTIPLRLLSEIGGVPVRELRALNPHLLRERVPSGGYDVWVPAGTGAVVQERYLASEFHRNGGHQTYRVKSGDSLWRIAKRHGTSVAAIRRASDLNTDVIRPGQRLLVPQ